jgi:hypothetical protein
MRGLAISFWTLTSVAVWGCFLWFLCFIEEL